MERLKELTARIKADAVLLSDEANIRYFTGFTGEGMALYHKGGFYIVTDNRYTQSAAQETEGRPCEVITIPSGSDMYKELDALVKKCGIASAAFEGEYLFVRQYNKLKESLSVAEWIELKDELDSLREIKKAEEIEKIREAERIGDMAFLHILSVIREGMTELEVAAEIEYALKKNNAETLSFETIVASGVNGDKPHAVPSEKIIKKGELITMDFGCKYKGYCSDMTRTIALGQIGDKQRLVYETVAKAQQAGFAAVRNGVRGCDVDAAARNVIKEAGFGEYFGHGLGHSLGLKIHENPRFSPICDSEIKTDMLMTVEPGIYIPNEMGVRIEDLVLVTNDGYEMISQSDRSLIQVDR